MKKTFFTLLFATLCLGVAAQTENPRGIYKLMTLVGKNGEVNSPFHQYKVCADSLTLMVSFLQRGIFRIGNNDHMVFNYTGDKPKSEDDKSILIYDSNADHFAEKWWSKFADHPIFPHNDWCIEKYKAGEYTPESRIVFDALNGKAEIDKKNPLTGTWRHIGVVVRKQLAAWPIPQAQRRRAPTLWKRFIRDSRPVSRHHLPRFLW